MAELIHTFTSGKMNKDLDERLVPNGEYRDALNLELASSDTSQVGTFQNIKGNLELRNKMYNPKTNAYNQWSNADYITALTNPVCVGAKADENSNDVYWFIASASTSVIAYYNSKTKLTKPLLVDTQGILNFSENYLITGINVIEGILIWTDNQTEPKKIFIEDWTNSTPNFVTHSQIYGRNFKEEDITVIKKYPLQPPVIAAYSNRVIDPATGLPGANIDTQTSASFYQTAGGSIVPLPAGSELLLEWASTTLPVYNYGDILLLTNAVNDPLDIDAVIRVEVTGLSSGGSQELAYVRVLSVGFSPEGATLLPITYDVTLEQKPPFFEMKFARFGYRYKYKNNEISAFSPFSNPVFIPGNFDYSPSQGYNLGMTNNVRQLSISDFVPSLTDYPDVIAVDILYKATNNQNVYVVDTFTNEDPEWGLNAFSIETEIITSVVNTNQILRPFDNVPRRAKAQEITANRLLFGNYTQNFNLLNNDGSLFQNNIQGFSVSVPVGLPTVEDSSPVNIEGKIVAPSVKSIRTYQIGVAYMDNYGRTTPVFTSKEASIIVPKTQAPSSTKLNVTLTGNNNDATLIPYYEQGKQFPYFKYYVKETSREYYNLALDRFYDAEDGNLWLSFPSAERNKVDEETFLILKKEHDSSGPVVEQARYKIIAIENEAPTYLKETKISLGAMDTDFTPQAFPIEGASKLEVFEEFFDAQFGAETRTESSLMLRVKAGASASNYYKIGSFALNNVTSPNRVVINSSEAFGPDMNFTSIPPYGPGFANADLQLEIVRVESINKAEFTGRFFVKVFQDDLLRRKIAQASNSATAVYTRKALGYLYNFERPGTTDSEGFWRNDWGDADAQGAPWRLFIDRIKTFTTAFSPRKGQGVYAENDEHKIDISWSDGFGLCESGPNNGIRQANPDLFNQLQSNTSLFRFINAGNGIEDIDPTAIYEVYNSELVLGTTWRNCGGGASGGENSSNQIARWTLSFRRAGTSNGGFNWNPQNEVANWVANDPTNYVNSYVGIEFLAPNEDDGSFSTANPAIFETEPKEAAELDIYWEVPKVYKTSDYSGSTITHSLDFFNCYSFGNGVESDRIRDDFNQPVIENGVKASATLDEPYNEEIRSSGVIFSQIFNSISGVNNLNQFIQAESITKDLNPEYGSIQKFHTRDTDLITLCENKSMKILAKKDILFNADGSTNLTSNAAVLGQTVPFQGEFGIATHPESFAEFGFRMYYTDATRGAVLRLSGDGLTDLSDYGMHSFFSDNLPINNKILGTWDPNKRNYNVTLNSLTPYWQQTLGAGKFDRLNKHPLCDQFVNSLPTTTTTVSYKEAINGFTSRKVYIPEAGAYLDNAYYTFKSGRIWEHGTNEKRNTFYNIGPDTPSSTQKSGNPYYESSFNTIFNENPAVIKGYKTLNYSGTKSKEYVYKVGASLQEYSLAQIQAQRLIPTSSGRTKGWYVNSILTDLQEGEIKEFVEKEGKYFNYIKGMPTFFTTNCDTNVDSSEFNVQGIGRATVVAAPEISQYSVTNEINPDCSIATLPPVLYKQTFIGLEDTLGSFNIAQSNSCSTPITFTLITDATTAGVLNLDPAVPFNGSFTFMPDLNFYGFAGKFTVVACCGDVCSDPAEMTILIEEVAENPYFTTSHPPITGLTDGDVWGYNPIGIDDPDHTPQQLSIVNPTAIPNFPSWMSPPEELLDGTGNWYIPDSIVSGGASNIDFTMTVIDPDGNTGTQRIQGDTIIDALLDLEFLVTTRGPQSSRTYTNPTTQQETEMTATAYSTHGCNRGTYKLLGNTSLVGRVYVGNAYETRDFNYSTGTFEGDQLYDTYTVDSNGNASSITGDVESSTSIPSAVAQGVTNTLLIDCSVTGVTCQKYITATDNFVYYLDPEPNATALSGLPKDRYNLVTITPAIAQQIIDQSSGPNPEIVSFGIAVDTYEANGVLNTHGEGVYLQVFKDGVEIYSQAQPNDSAVTINVLTGEIL